MSRLMTRRRFLIGSTLTASALGLSGCDALVQNDKVQTTLKLAEGLTKRAQRLLIGDNTLAREYTLADISPSFRANGTSMPDGAQYSAIVVDAIFRSGSWRSVASSSAQPNSPLQT